MLGYQQKKNKIRVKLSYKNRHHCARYHSTMLPIQKITWLQSGIYIYIYICNVNLFSSDKNNNNIYNKTDTLINRYSKIGEYSCTHENFLLIYHDYKNQYECKTK